MREHLPARDERGIGRPSLVGVAVGAATVLPGFLVGALALQLRADLGASVEAVGAGVTVFFLAGAAAAGAGGRLADRIGALAAMRAAAAITAGCLLAIAAAADSLAVLYALLTLAGLANAVSQTAINLFMADQVSRERQGLAFGIKQSGIPAAILVSGLALPALALPLGWRATFALCGGGVIAVAAVLGRGAASFPPGAERRPAPAPSRELVLLAAGAALASAGPCALGAYLVASAVEAGIAEGAAGLLAALGSATSLLVRMALGARADRRRDYGFGTVVMLLALGAGGFALLAMESATAFVAGTLIAFALGWGWPGLFNLAVVVSNRAAPGAATGITQTGIYVGAASGPAAFGAIAAGSGYGTAWTLVAATSLLAALAIWLAARDNGDAPPERAVR